MTRRIYSVRDKKLKQFAGLVFFDNDAVAVRSFGDLVMQEKESLYHKHPSDFSLCFLGEFDSVSGGFSAPPDFVVVADADSFVKE